MDENGPRNCPKRPLDIVAIERPDLRFPASCDAYRCPVCGPRKARTSAALATYALRQSHGGRLVTLTLAPGDWQSRRQKIRDLRRWALANGWDWEMFWATEANPKGTGVHVHGIQTGRQKIPQASLQDRWGHIVDIRRVRTPAAGAYVVKEAMRVAGYVVKNGTESAEALDAHLALNGGRAAHWTRGFLGGLTKREALAKIREEQAGEEALTWVLVPPGVEPPPSVAHLLRRKIA